MVFLYCRYSMFIYVHSLFKVTNLPLRCLNKSNRIFHLKKNGVIFIYLVTRQLNFLSFEWGVFPFVVDQNYLFKYGVCFNQFVLETGQRRSEKGREQNKICKYAEAHYFLRIRTTLWLYDQNSLKIYNCSTNSWENLVRYFSSLNTWKHRAQLTLCNLTTPGAKKAKCVNISIIIL